MGDGSHPLRMGRGLGGGKRDYRENDGSQQGESQTMLQHWVSWLMMFFTCLNPVDR
jgi:hypothetical protein